ncbi:toprim domain-containing protein [Bacillus sp. D386]|uniref:toprim domain-containing protein n=1 Tax=Bacillus sp. D386 TaxID=2587155 RepID=UPI001123C5AC|nr:toprim domain-containing protein [Bacillus sp. D386]
MQDAQSEKVIIVEGSTDRQKIQSVLNESVDIRCTNGTISLSKLDELVDELEQRDVYILADADESGEKLRKQLRREMPNASHIYIDRTYREVANAPRYHLATVLLAANIDVKAEFLKQMKDVMKNEQSNHDK